MKINIIGHASLFVETKDCRILMDPLLWDPHQEGLFDVCPKREVIAEKIPEFDVLIISHRHLDHFDIRSLAYLPKHVDVLIPEDKLIEKCLKKLGYINIYSLQDFNEVKLGSTRLFATRSENRVPEFGIVFADESGVCWNQVDTIVSIDTIRVIKHRYEKIDFLLTVWQPMLEANYHTHRSIAFPYEVYSKMLQNVSLISPKAIAPGSNGFKCIDDSSWLNQIVFPVTQEQFREDVKAVCPEVAEKIFLVDPGDIMVIDRAEVEHLKGECPFVKKLADEREVLDFSPVTIDSKMVDNNRDNYDLELMKQTIYDEVKINLPEFIKQFKDIIFIEHCRWKVIYQLEVVFPDGSVKWSFDFAQKEVSASSGRNPRANLFTYIIASNFYSIIQQIKGWDFAQLGGYYRHFNKIYAATPHGIVKPDEEEIGQRFVDPLIAKFPYEKLLRSILQKELNKWGPTGEKDTPPPESKTAMLKMGNTLVRLKK